MSPDLMIFSFEHNVGGPEARFPFREYCGKLNERIESICRQSNFPGVTKSMSKICKIPWQLKFGV